MPEYTIEKNIPTPKPRFCEVKYPWERLEIGDSFIVPDHNKWNSVKNAARLYGKRHNLKFTSRIVREGLRIWRVE